MMSYNRWSTFALLGALTLACLTQACATKETSEVKTEPKSDVKKQAFGKTPDGADVELYTLTNANGMQAGIINYGGTVVSLTAPDRNGKYADVVLGLDDLAGYTKGDRVLRRADRPLWQPHRPRASSNSTATLTSCRPTITATRCTADPRASTSASGALSRVPAPTAKRSN